MDASFAKNANVCAAPTHDILFLSLPTVVFPRDLRKKEKFIKHITGEASLRTSVSPVPGSQEFEKVREALYIPEHYGMERGWQRQSNIQESE